MNTSFRGDKDLHESLQWLVIMGMHVLPTFLCIHAFLSARAVGIASLRKCVHADMVEPWHFKGSGSLADAALLLEYPGRSLSIHAVFWW